LPNRCRRGPPHRRRCSNGRRSDALAPEPVSPRAAPPTPVLERTSLGYPGPRTGVAEGRPTDAGSRTDVARMLWPQHPCRCIPLHRRRFPHGGRGRIRPPRVSPVRVS
jgi:hypothetical protein